jgi:methyl-accepting chemotaxis protein
MLTLNPQRRNRNAERGLPAAWNWLMRPRQDLPLDLQRRSYLLNFMLLTQIAFLLFFTGLAMLGNFTNRIFIAVLLSLSGAILAYLLARAGEALSAAWLSGGSTLAGITYYILTTPNVLETIYLDYRSSVVLMVLPIMVMGIATGVRSCAAFTGLCIVIFTIVGIWFVPPLDQRLTGFAFYAQLMRIPFAILVICAALAIIFERNIFGLFERLAKRNENLQAIAQQLSAKRSEALGLAHELTQNLAELKNSFEQQLHSADRQQVALVDVGTALEELGRVARRIDSLATQASQVATDAVEVAGQGANVIKTNVFAYKRLQENLQVINNSVDGLSHEAGQIDGVVGSVGEVAEETNLLSLNASIESAGHREHGRRFASVAGEVQRLAQRSRDAAEEVRRVVDLVQGSVKKLSNLTDESRRRANTLSDSTQTSAITINDIVQSVGKSAQLSQNILGSLHNQQGAVGGILERMNTVAMTSQEVRATSRRLLRAVEELEQALAGMGDEIESTLPADDPDAEEEPDGSQAVTPTGWRYLLGRLVRVSSKMPVAQRRNSRLLNVLSLILVSVLFLNLPFVAIFNYNLNSIATLSLLIVLGGFVYALNKSGLYDPALFVFFSACLITFSMYLFGLTDSLSIRDFIKTNATLLAVPIMGAATLANKRWILWLTGIAISLTIIYAVILVPRNFGGLVSLLTYPVGLLGIIGALAYFLHMNITRLTEQLAEQNSQIARDNRELHEKQVKETVLNHQIENLATGMSSAFERQSELALSQLQNIREITSRMEGLEQGARRLVRETESVVQSANAALEYSRRGEASIGESLQITENFRQQIAHIAATSAELQTQAGEIGQTFELITDVAEEIDLLALNATVEASQARLAGKRFGAVASEVQRLAAHARKASGTVQLIVARVQTAVAICAELTERGQHEIGQLSDAAHETDYSIQEIVKIVSNTSSLMGQIQEAVEQQAEAIGQILTRLRDIANAAQALKDTTMTSRDSIARLNRTAESFSRMAQAPELGIGG